VHHRGRLTRRSRRSVGDPTAKWRLVTRFVPAPRLARGLQHSATAVAPGMHAPAAFAAAWTAGPRPPGPRVVEAHAWRHRRGFCPGRPGARLAAGCAQRE
jgi:hypothetical protein